MSNRKISEFDPAAPLTVNHVLMLARSGQNYKCTVDELLDVDNFTPNRPYTPSAWFRSTDLTLNNGDPVTTWPDASGHGNNATQSDPNLKPIYKVNIFGSLPAVQFSVGTFPQYLNLTSPFLWGASDPWTILVVAQLTEESYLCGHSTTNCYLLAYYRGGNTLIYRDLTLTRVSMPLENAPELTRLLGWRKTSSAHIWFYENRRLNCNNTTSGGWSLDQIGTYKNGTAEHGTRGYIAEFIVWSYNLPHSAIDRLYLDYFWPRYPAITS
jgi:hypothetical protein